MNLNKSRSVAAWLVFISYYLAVSLLHLRFSMFLDRPLPGIFGKIRPLSLVDPVLAISLGLLALILLYQFLKSGSRWRFLAFWVGWLFSVALVHRFLLFKTVEYIHYPQYGILAALLIWCLDPGRRRVCAGRVLFWATVLGIFDELHQYMYLARSYGDYLDFNDFFLNLQGAAAGIMLAYGFAGSRSAADCEGEPEKAGDAVPSCKGMARGIAGSIELCFVAAALAVVILLGVSGRVRLSPPKAVPPGGLAEENGRMVFYLERKPGMMGKWNGGVLNPTYYVLSPAGGALLLAGAGLVFTFFGPARKP